MNEAAAVVSTHDSILIGFGFVVALIAFWGIFVSYMIRRKNDREDHLGPRQFQGKGSVLDQDIDKEEPPRQPEAGSGRLSSVSH